MPSKALTIYYCGSEECEGGHSFGPAVRTQYLLHYICSGRGTYNVGEKSWALGAGMGFLIKPGESTYYKADDLEPWSYIWVAFDGYEAGNILRSCGIDYTMQAKRPDEFESRLRYLVTVFGTAGHNELEYQGIFYQAVSQLVKDQPKAEGSYEKLYFEKAAEYIQDNYSYPITIADTARYVGIDRTYLYKLFVEFRGLSPKQFLLLIRINAAKAMMTGNSYSLSEVALSCGFKDSSAFCTHFKNITGKTPKQFKLEIKENNRHVKA